jgi:hypothetical protein
VERFGHTLHAPQLALARFGVPEERLREEILAGRLGAPTPHIFRAPSVALEVLSERMARESKEAIGIHEHIAERVVVAAVFVRVTVVDGWGRGLHDCRPVRRATNDILKTSKTTPAFSGKAVSRSSSASAAASVS